MKQPLHARILLTGIVFVFANCSAPAQDSPVGEAAFPRQIKQTETFEIHQLGKSTYAFHVRHGKYRELGCNAGFIVTPKGVILVDTQISKEAEQVVLGEIRAITDRPIIHIINTHGHHDHVSGNDVHAKDADIIAHRDTVAQWSPESEGARKPRHPIGKNLTLLSGAERVEILCIGRSHSIGDLAVYHPADKVLYTGDLYVRNLLGYLGEGHFQEWIKTLEQLQALRPEVVVPGHGTIGDAKPMGVYRDYLGDFCASTREHFINKGTVDNYELPAKYQEYGAKSFLPDNIERAHELWKEGKLDFVKDLAR